MIDPALLQTLGTIARAFDELEVAWAVGGSVASTIYGEPRATNDEYLQRTASSARLGALLERAEGEAGRTR